MIFKLVILVAIVIMLVITLKDSFTRSTPPRRKKHY